MRLNYLSFILAYTFIAGPSAIAQDRIIVEAGTGGQNHQYYIESEGVWFDSRTPSWTAKSTASGLSSGEQVGSRFTSADATPAKAKFVAPITKDGKYNVSVTWPKAANAAPVAYTIGGAAEGTLSTERTQDGWIIQNHNAWHLLGTFSFKAGTTATLEMDKRPNIRRPAGDQSGRVYADAVKWERVEDSAPTGLAPQPNEKPKPVVPTTSNGTSTTTQSAPAQVVDIVVESRAEGKNFANYSEAEGNFANSGNATGQGKSKAPSVSDGTKVGSRKLIVTNPATGSAFFSPNLKSPQQLNVYVTWPREANAGPVTYVIKHTGGVETKSVNQNGWGSTTAGSNANIWYSLGRYTFGAGKEFGIELKVDQNTVMLDSRNLAQVYADAARFTSESLTETGSAPLSSNVAASTTRSNTRTTPATPTGNGATATRAQVNWVNDIAEAMSVATRDNKKILMFFYSPDSAGSSHFDNTVFTNAAVARELTQRFVCVRLNFVENTKTAYNLQVYRAGIVMLYDKDGSARAKIDTQRTAANFLRDLQGVQ